MKRFYYLFRVWNQQRHWWRLGGKMQRMKYFHLHPPFPCIRQHTVNLKLYRNQMDRVWFLNQDWSQDYSISCLLPLSHCTYQQDVATGARWFLKVSVSLCVHACTPENSILLLLGLFNGTGDYTVNKSFQRAGWPSPKNIVYICLYIHII